MWLKRSRVSFIPISVDLLELFHHNRESLYFVCLIGMLGVGKFHVKDYVVLSQQFCLSTIYQQTQRICITRAVFFSAKFWKKKSGLFCPPCNLIRYYYDLCMCMWVCALSSWKQTKMYRIMYISYPSKASSPLEFTNPLLIIPTKLSTKLSPSISRPNLLWLLFYNRHAAVTSIFTLSLKLQRYLSCYRWHALLVSMVISQFKLKSHVCC